MGIPNQRRNSRRHVVEQAEASLRRFQTDYIDTRNRSPSVGLLTDTTRERTKGKMKKFVSTVGLSLLLGCLGGCGDDLGTPTPDGGKADGGGNADGGVKIDGGPSASDGGGKVDLGAVDVGPVDSAVVVDAGAVDVIPNGDASGGPDVSRDTTLTPVVLDGGAWDTGPALDSAADGAVDGAGDHPAGLDGGGADTGSPLEVGIDSDPGIDGSPVG